MPETGPEVENKLPHFSLATYSEGTPPEIAGTTYYGFSETSDGETTTIVRAPEGSIAHRVYQEAIKANSVRQ